MELLLYNVVMTAMNLTGRGFAYVNQLASLEEDFRKREEWFVCACCLLNLIRLFGCPGRYFWDYRDYRVKGDKAFINVHLYTSAKVELEAKRGKVSIQQTSNWLWEGNVKFEISLPVPTVVRLRLPAWSREEYTLKPPLSEEICITKGYFTLSPSYVAATLTFTIKIHNMGPRYIVPHPYMNQHTLTLAQGPIIYCAEDVDNPWEENHFKDIVLKRGSEVREATTVAEETRERYVALRTTCWKRGVGEMVEGCAGEAELADTTGK